MTVNPLVRTLADYPLARLDALKESLRAEGRPLYDFGVGDPREPTPPFVRDAVRAAVPEVSQYPSAAGRPGLRCAAAGYMARRFGVELDPAREVIASAGAKEAVFHLPLVLVDPRAARRAVVYGLPGYPVYERGTRFAGGEAHPVALRAEDGWRLEPSRVAPEVLDRTAIFWINYPHNPTGAVADAAYLERVVAASEKHGFRIASDECYADLWFEEPPPSILQVTRTRALALHSLSKRSGMTGYRTGFIAGDAEAVGALARMRATFGVGSPDFVQQAAEVAWADDAHVEERRRAFAAKRAVMVEGLSAMGLRVGDARATIYLWVGVPAGETAESYAARLARQGIVVTPGVVFGEGEGYVRVALVPTVEQCRAAVELWRTA